MLQFVATAQFMLPSDSTDSTVGHYTHTYTRFSVCVQIFIGTTKCRKNNLLNNIKHTLYADIISVSLASLQEIKDRILENLSVVFVHTCV